MWLESRILATPDCKISPNSSELLFLEAVWEEATGSDMSERRKEGRSTNCNTQLTS
jgi:hypothetical protein